MLRRVALVLVVSLAACTPEVCQTDSLPYLGRPTTPEQLFEVVQYSARNDCCGPMYHLLSKRTQDEHSRTKFCLFWESLRLPEPFAEYRVVDVVSKGEFLAVLPDPTGRQFMFVHYQEPGKVALDAQLLLVFEQGEPRLGLQDQVDQALPFAQPPAK
ncbi:MAG: hypothetical protein KF878_31030 [Planctomycetes bacterium]|nr:hypothetical protein [Planctomycetota bacterium]